MTRHLANRPVVDMPPMSDTSQGPGWWLASDGRWYPPESLPNLPPPPPPGPRHRIAPQGVHPLSRTVSLWTQGLMWCVAAFQVIQGLVAIQYWQAVNAWNTGRRSLDDMATAEENYNAVASLSLVVWFAGIVMLIVWLAKAHTTTTSMLPGEQLRKYSKGWSIGAWFIPIANVISVPQIFAENQRIAEAPRVNGVVTESWRSTPIRPNLVWWWLLTVGGSIAYWAGAETIGDPERPIHEYLTGISMISIGCFVSAVGIAIGARLLTDLSKKMLR